MLLKQPTLMQRITFQCYSLLAVQRSQKVSCTIRKYITVSKSLHKFSKQNCSSKSFIHSAVQIYCMFSLLEFFLLIAYNLYRNMLIVETRPDGAFQDRSSGSQVQIYALLTHPPQGFIFRSKLQ